MLAQTWVADVIGCRGVLCVEDLVRAGLQGVPARGKCKCKGPGVGRNKVGSSNLDRACGWSIASKGHSFIEVVGDANWAKSWGYLLDHAGLGLLIAALDPRSR